MAPRRSQSFGEFPVAEGGAGPAGVHEAAPRHGHAWAAQASGAMALEEARRAGLLEGERSEHMSFRAPKALVDAAMRQSGLTSRTELGIAALALLAQPDPVAAFFEETFGDLGSDFDLEY